MDAIRIDNSSPIPLYVQVAQLIEQLILGNALSANEILPGVAALAKQLKVSPLTVQKAFSSLQERGLIYSIVGKGTFVAEVSNQQYVGLLVHSQYMVDGARVPTLPLFVQGITEELKQHGIRMRLLTDSYPRFQELSPICPDVLSTLEHSRPIGLVMLYHFGSEQLFEFAKARNIPTVGVGFSSRETTASMVTDQDAMLETIVRRLRDQSVESAGVLWLDRGNGRPVQLKMLNTMLEIFEKCGVQTRPEWLVGVHEASDWAGYHAFNHLMDMPNRPQALIVQDDVIGRGVHLGVMSRQLSVPDDLVLVVQANEDSPITFPENWQQYGHNLRECAQLTANVMRTLINGIVPPNRECTFPSRWRSFSTPSQWTTPTNDVSTATGRPRVFWTGQQLLNATGR